MFVCPHPCHSRWEGMIVFLLIMLRQAAGSTKCEELNARSNVLLLQNETSLDKPGSLTLRSGEFTYHIFPYLVSIRMKGQHICSGIIIHDSWVLTVAQCLYSREHRLLSPDFFSVSAGNSEVVGKKGKCEQERKVVHLFPYPKFDPETLENDIALMKMLTRFRICPYQVSTAVIYGRGSKTYENYCTVVGWGFQKVGKNTSKYGLIPVLKEIQVSVLHLKECRQKHIDQVIEWYYLCAGNDTEFMCAEDKGGPIICRGAVRALSSWGSACGHNNYPGVFIRVRPFKTWTQSRIRAAAPTRMNSVTTSSVIFILIIMMN